MNRRLFSTSLSLVFVLSTMAGAHLNKTSLSIKGGETFKAGEKVTISWKIAIIHSKPNYLYFSSASSEPWQLFDSVPEKSGTFDMSYIWTVPSKATTTARIRVFQSAVAKPGEQTDDYTLVSQPFTIHAETTPVVVVPKANVQHLTTASTVRAGAYDIIGRHNEIPEYSRNMLQKRLFKAP